MDALAKALSKVEPKAVRYCGMCDKYVSAKQTVCKACGADTEKAERDHD
jgi:hypothetical protein